MKYNINHKKLGIQLLPTVLRNYNFVAYITALLTPLQSLYDDFISNKNRLSKEAKYNSQIMLFEYLLNSKFDPLSRRITIQTTSSAGVRVNAVQKQEGAKINAYLKNEGFSKVTANQKKEESTVDFEVYIPSVLTTEERSIKRMINIYRLSSKQFEIKIL